MSVIMLVLMAVIDEYPGVRAKMIAAMGQIELTLHDRWDTGPSLPGDR
jgi:hypothetical protein